MLQRGVGVQDRVVRLHDGGGHLGGGVDGEPQLGLLAVVHGEPLHQQGGKPRPGTSPEAVKHEETLETARIVRHATDAVQGYLKYGQKFK